MVQGIKLEHYVPKFYLKTFACKKGKEFQLYCYDKPNENSFPVNIRNIGCESYFYDLPEDESQDLEKRLATFEGKASFVYHKIILLERFDILTEEEKAIFAVFLALQFIRTKEKREMIKDSIRQLKERLSGETLAPHLVKQLEEASSDAFTKKLYISLLKEINRYAKIMLSMKWILMVNKTGKPLFSSDNPLALFNHIDLSPYGNLGLLSQGIEIHFPLSPTLTLCVCDPSYYYLFPEKADFDDIENVIFQNHLQVKFSTRHIFSPENDFSLVEQMISDHPDLKDINRKRIIVQ